MGLDMYLVAKRGLYCDDDIAEELAAVFPELKNQYPIREVSAEVGYWRKANHIHYWFVKNVQRGVDNCGEYYVSTDKLDMLREVCKTVLTERNESMSKLLLPTAEGFFFGDMEYDEYYYEDVQSTLDIIEKVLTLPEKWYLYYHSSW